MTVVLDFVDQSGPDGGLDADRLIPDLRGGTYRMHAHRPKITTGDFQSIETALSWANGATS